MQPTKVIVVAGLFLFAAFAGLQWTKRPAAPPPGAALVAPYSGSAEKEAPPFLFPVEPTFAAPAEIPPASTPLPQTAVAALPRPAAMTTAPSQTPRATNPQQLSTGNSSALRPKEPVQDPLAREALSFVGLDRQAEEYWLDAINDPSLSAHEREDLIEDLNEDGLPDPKHPIEDDLPLIVRRLQLIEAFGDDAMDEVNAAAFAEAYKDLVNLAEIATGGGAPVR